MKIVKIVKTPCSHCEGRGYNYTNVDGREGIDLETRNFRCMVVLALASFYAIPMIVLVGHDAMQKFIRFRTEPGSMCFIVGLTWLVIFWALWIIRDDNHLYEIYKNTPHD